MEFAFPDCRDLQAVACGYKLSRPFAIMATFPGKDEEQPVFGTPGSSMIDVNQLASILMQARGPIIDRLERSLSKFSGDGSQDAAVWLDDLERRCRAERVGPEEVIDFLLEGNAARMFRALRVSEASQWEVVKGALLSQYGMSRQEAYTRFADRQLQVDESVDVYVDDLQRYGARIEVKPGDMIFKARFIDGLTPSLHKWVVLLPEVYSSDFDIILSKVRDRASAQKAASSKQKLAAASGKQGPVCLRCSGPHLVRNCTQKRHRATSKGRASSRSRGLCFRCEKPGHFARDCPGSKVTAASPGIKAGFPQEDVERGTASSNEEVMEG